MTEYPQDPSAHSHQPPAQPGPGFGVQGQAPLSPADARMWSMLAHLGGILFAFVPSLVIYLVFRERDPFVRRHSSQALSFQVIATIAYAVSNWLPLVGFLVGTATFVCVVVFSVMAAIASNKGQDYTYPLVPKMIT